MKMSNLPAYTIKPLDNKDQDEAMIFLKRTFYVDEPMNRAVGILSEPNDTHPWLDTFTEQALCQGLSFKAIDGNGRIIALVVNGIDPLKEPDDGTDVLSLAKRCPDPKFQKILYVIAAANEEAKLWEKYPKEERLMEIKIAATDLHWRKRGIMNELVIESEKKAKELGINLLRMDTSSAYSAKSAENCGFTCVYEKAYKDIKLDGKPIIVPEPPHSYDRIYTKVLK